MPWDSSCRLPSLPPNRRVAEGFQQVGNDGEHMMQAEIPPVPASLPSWPQRRRVSSAELMQGAREVVIMHAGEEYILRITKTGKLILTK